MALPLSTPPDTTVFGLGGGVGPGGGGGGSIGFALGEITKPPGLTFALVLDTRALLRGHRLRILLRRVPVLALAVWALALSDRTLAGAP